MLSQVGTKTWSLEVHKPTSVSALKDAIDSRSSGTLDIFINNAGRNYTVSALDVNFDEVQSLFEINLFSVIPIFNRTDHQPHTPKL